MMEITLGVQSEGSACGLISRMHPRVNELFEKYMEHDYCPDIDGISLILRLGSWRKEFGPDGVERRRFMKKLRYISIDLVLNENSYKDQTDVENRETLLGLMQQGLERCVEKLQIDKCKVDAERLFNDFSKFKNDFRRRWKPKLRR